MLSEMDEEVTLEILTDSSAGKSIASRRGVGRVRRLQSKDLWLQEAVADRKIQITKIEGGRNHVDIETKHVKPEVLSRHFEAMGMVKLKLPVSGESATFSS